MTKPNAERVEVTILLSFDSTDRKLDEDWLVRQVERLEDNFTNAAVDIHFENLLAEPVE